jgi:cytochrome c oxidase subunit 1
VRILTTTDHKVIGNLYFATSFFFFMIGGVLALLIRAELVEPGLQIVDNPEEFNQFFTMHGTIMLLLFATPLFAGFANAIMPLQIGAPDVAFPRLNMFAYWLYLFGGLATTGRGTAASRGPPTTRTCSPCGHGSSATSSPRSWSPRACR